MIEGVLNPAEEISTKLEHEGLLKHDGGQFLTRERAYMLKKTLVEQYEDDSFAIPPSGDVRGDARRENAVAGRYDRSPEAIRKFQPIMVRQLKQRNFDTVTDEATLMCFLLNPSVKSKKWLSISELEQAHAVFKKHYDRVADMLEAKQGSSAGPSRGSAPSPAKAQQADPKRAKVTRTVEERMDENSSSDDGSGDDNVGEASASAPSVSRAAESECFTKITKADIARAKGSNGKFDVLLFWSMQKANFPIHFILALVFYGTLCTEAGCERVFRFSGQTLAPQRTCLGPLILQAFVTIAYNDGVFDISDEELLDAYNDMGSSLALEASEVPDGGAGQGGAEQDEEEEEEEGEM